MSDDNQHKAKLLDLGFPEAVADEASGADESGLFDTEPSPDLPERISENLKDTIKKPSPDREG